MKYKLNIEVAFTDKNNNAKHYKIGDVITVDEARGNELLADSRKLVSLNEIIEDEETKKAKAKAEKEAKAKAEEEAKKKAEEEAAKKQKRKKKRKPLIRNRGEQA